MNTSQFSTLAQLQQLIHQIDILENKILLKNVVSIPYFKGDKNYPSNLNTILSNALYEYFYCIGLEADLREKKPFGINASPQKLAFIEKLKSHTSINYNLDNNWRITNRDITAKLSLEKGQYRRTALPGEYINQAEFISVNDQGYVGIWKRAYQASLNNAFFFIYGQTLTDEYSPFLIRFYFNLKPEGAPKLVQLLSEQFNHFLLPFSFKCLNDPESYNRADAGVLYLAKNYAAQAWEILQENYEAISDYLKPEAPLFTLPLKRGISFAENPPMEGHSFGTSRCEIIANGIAEAYQKGMDKSKWFELILAKLSDQNLDPKQLYLNPNAYYPYPFKPTNHA